MAIEKDEKQRSDTEARERAINVLHTLSRPEALRYWKFLYGRYDGALPWQCITVGGTKVKWTANVEGFQIYFRLFREDRPNGWIYPHGSCRHLLPIDWCALCGQGQPLKARTGRTRHLDLSALRPPDWAKEHGFDILFKKALSLIISAERMAGVKKPKPTEPMTEQEWNGWLDMYDKLQSPEDSVGKDIEGWCYRFGLAIKTRMGTAWTTDIQFVCDWFFEQLVEYLFGFTKEDLAEYAFHEKFIAPHLDDLRNTFRMAKASAPEYFRADNPNMSLFNLAAYWGWFGEACVRLIFDEMKEFNGDPIILLGAQSHGHVIYPLASSLGGLLG